MWGVLASTIIGALAGSIGSLVGRALVALGIGFVTYNGSQFAIDQIVTVIKNSFSGAPAEVVGLLAFLWVDKALGAMFSAFSAAMVIKGVGGVTKMQVKK